MLYHLDVDIDYARMGSDKGAIRAAEHARVKDLVAEGVVVCEWLKANGLGILAIWDCRDHAHLRDLLASLPMTPYLSQIEIEPCVDHPLFPEGRCAPAQMDQTI
ncbi:MAG: muconolactone Delta-isomerase family protein [Roseiarcus sp.]